MATGTVQRFDLKRGFGFIKPDVEGGADVFVHQNDIEMEGFRSLQADEKVEYDEEIGEKGPKATHVKLLSPRAPRPQRDQRGGDRGQRRPAGGGAPRQNGDRLDKLIQLLIGVDVVTADEVRNAGL